jgi:hypothetical protein
MSAIIRESLYIPCHSSTNRLRSTSVFGHVTRSIKQTNRIIPTKNDYNMRCILYQLFDHAIQMNTRESYTCEPSASRQNKCMCSYQRHCVPRHQQKIDPSELDALPSTLRDKILQMHFRAIHQDKYARVCQGIEARKKQRVYVYAHAFNFMHAYMGIGELAYST